MNVQRSTIWRIKNKAQNKILNIYWEGNRMFNNFDLSDEEILKIFRRL